MVGDGGNWLIGLACLLGGYLCGSIPFGLIFGKLFGLGDIRKIGSGNIGATNALRTGNSKMAALTLAGDVLKGTVPVLVAGYAVGQSWTPEAAAVAGFGAFLGHVFPVWLGFKGGKGVATYLGILLGIAPIGVLVFAVLWLGVAFATEVFVAGSPCRHARRADRLCAAWLRRRGRPDRHDDGSRLHQAPPEHPPAGRRHRRQDRSQGMIEAARRPAAWNCRRRPVSPGCA